MEQNALLNGITYVDIKTLGITKPVSFYYGLYPMAHYCILIMSWNHSLSDTWLI